jgi:serine acetyltransferase
MADVGAKATIGAGSVVAQDVPEGAKVSGNPARVLGAEAKPLA